MSSGREKYSVLSVQRGNGNERYIMLGIEFQNIKIRHRSKRRHVPP